MPLACAINLSLISLLSSLSFLVGFAFWCHLPFKADEEAASGLIISAASFLLYLRCLVVFFFVVAFFFLFFFFEGRGGRNPIL